MTILEMPQPKEHLHICPECGIGILIDSTVTYTFPFGFGPNQIRLPVTHVAGVCQNPKCQWILCDYRAERAIELAISTYEQDAQTIQGANEPTKREPPSNQDPTRNT
jgi:hypothetical protein